MVGVDGCGGGRLWVGLVGRDMGLTQKHLVLGIENNVEMLWWAICADLIALRIFWSTHKIE